MTSIMNNKSKDYSTTTAQVKSIPKKLKKFRRQLIIEPNDHDLDSISQKIEKDLSKDLLDKVYKENTISNISKAMNTSMMKIGYDYDFDYESSKNGVGVYKQSKGKVEKITDKTITIDGHQYKKNKITNIKEIKNQKIENKIETDLSTTQEPIVEMTETYSENDIISETNEMIDEPIDWSGDEEEEQSVPEEEEEEEQSSDDEEELRKQQAEIERKLQERQQKKMTANKEKEFKNNHKEIVEKEMEKQFDKLNKFMTKENLDMEYLVNLLCQNKPDFKDEENWVFETAVYKRCKQEYLQGGKDKKKGKTAEGNKKQPQAKGDKRVACKVLNDGEQIFLKIKDISYRAVYDKDADMFYELNDSDEPIKENDFENINQFGNHIYKTHAPQYVGKKNMWAVMKLRRDGQNLSMLDLPILE